MREGEGAQVEAAKNALRCFASKLPFYSVKRSSETAEERGGTPVQHLSVPTSSLKVLKAFFPLFMCSRRLLLPTASVITLRSNVTLCYDCRYCML